MMRKLGAGLDPEEVSLTVAVLLDAVNVAGKLCNIKPILIGTELVHTHLFISD